MTHRASTTAPALRISSPLAAGPASRRVFIVNPFARGVDRAAVSHAAMKLGLSGRSIREAGRDGSVRSLAAEAVRAGTGRLIVAGGDGTLHDVVQEISGTGTALGVIPLGTSNDLAARLNVPAPLDAACRAALQGVTAAVDLVALGDTMVATVGGFGLPALVARNCTEIRAGLFGGVARLLGRGIYSAVAAGHIASRGAAAVRLDLRTDTGTRLAVPVSALLVGAIERFGGGLRLATREQLVPGTFAALVITAASRAGLLAVLLRLKAGLPVRRGAQLLAGLTTLDIHAADPLATFGDGEWLGLRHRAHISVRSGALLAIVPAAPVPFTAGQES